MNLRLLAAGSSLFVLILISLTPAESLALGGILDIFRPQESRHLIIDSTEDDAPVDDIRQVADVLCQWSGKVNADNNLDERKQISRISTIGRLVSFFNDLESNGNSFSVYGKCAERYKRILGDLHEVVGTRPDNVCSDASISAIERFHNNHLSTVAGSPAAVSSQGGQRSTGAEDPVHPMLGLFFMYYAMEVSAICKGTVLNSIKLDLGRFAFSHEEYQLGEHNNLARLLSGISDYLGPLDKITDFDDVVYIWDLLDNGIMGKIIKSTLRVDDGSDGNSDDNQERVDPETGAPVRLLIKVKNGRTARFIQQKCLRRFRPVYSQIIVPVTRLSNLGYSSQSSDRPDAKSELLNNELIKKWYSLTQVCEAIRPIKFYEDASLGPEEAIIMTRKEATQLEENTFGQIHEQPMIEYEPKTNGLQGMDRLYSVDKPESQQLVRRVKLNVSAHDRSVGRIFGRLLRNSFDVIRGKIIENMGKIFMFRKAAADQQTVKHDLEQELSDSISKLSEEDLRELEAKASPSSSLDADKTAAVDVSTGSIGIILNVVNACASLDGQAE